MTESQASSNRMTEMLPGFEKFRRIWDSTNNRYAVKILPGEYYVTACDELIITTLGSCISACIRDRIRGIGGMNHFMLPSQTLNCETWNDPRVSLANRYGNYAMENLINDIVKNGGKKNNLEVKIFGGGKILNHMTDIGLRNINFIEEYILTEQLNLVAKDVGNDYPRKIIYYPADGVVKVKKLQSLQNKTIFDLESRYLQDIYKRRLTGTIELFDKD